MQEKNENSKKIIERLLQFIELQGDNFNKLSQNIGVSNSYFSKMSKNNGSIGVEIIVKIVKYYEKLNIDWLITGRGNMLYYDNDNIPTNNINNELIKIIETKDKQIDKLLKIIEKK